jgi:4-hydroxybenzoate polyprenyltransferase
MTWTVRTALELGRVSNLPTVWSNTLAGVVLAGVSPLSYNILILLLAMTLAYTGGMFLNDAFDRTIDAKERPERPIPSGRIKAAEVYAAGFTLLAGAIFFCLLATMSWGGSHTMATGSAILLCITIVAYNKWHKNNPYSPLLMGGCRALVLLCAGYCAARSPNTILFIAAIVLFAYLIGLTYVAKQENIGQVKNLWPLLFLIAPIGFGLWATTTDLQMLLPTAFLTLWLGYCVLLIKRRASGDIPRAVVAMIAGMSLVDVIFIASVSSVSIAALGLIAFFATLALQQLVKGT